MRSTGLIGRSIRSEAFSCCDYTFIWLAAFSDDFHVRDVARIMANVVFLVVRILGNKTAETAKYPNTFIFNNVCFLYGTNACWFIMVCTIFDCN